MAEKKPATLAQKLLAMQKAVDKVIKDGHNTSDKYDFASDENVLDTFRPLMDEHGLLLIPLIDGAAIHEGATRSGTARYLTELHMTMLWLDAETGEELRVPWYAQGVDLAGEKGPGKALTYAEKYFLLKFFHVSTKKDDPDNGGRTQSGELRQNGTQAAAENTEYFRAALTQMANEISGGDAEKMKLCVITWTKAEKRGYAGVDEVKKVSAAALPVAYAKAKKQYESRMGKQFELVKEDA